VSCLFINYRTGDEEGSAALIEGGLSRRFGNDKIFRASKSIRLGEDFEQVILRAVRRSNALIAVIGARWLTAPDGHGGRALDNEADWTRREIVEALMCDVLVIPVLIGGTPRLAKDDLPAALAELAVRQYERLDHRNVDADIIRLGDKLAQLVDGLDDAAAPADGSVRGATTQLPHVSARQGNFFSGPVTARDVVAGNLYQTREDDR